MTKLTPRQKALRKKYTRVTGFLGGVKAELHIDHQGFHLHESSSRKSANWTCDMLAIALDRLIEHEKGE